VSVVEHAVLHPAGEHAAEEFTGPVPTTCVTCHTRHGGDVTREQGGGGYKWILSREQPYTMDAEKKRAGLTAPPVNCPPAMMLGVWGCNARGLGL